jgi:tRNA dimethylallyltransferase
LKAKTQDPYYFPFNTQTPQYTNTPTPSHPINTPIPQHPNTPTLLVILGPTAIGKTSLSIELAKALGTEILSADSRQFFREMTIGTAKPSVQELAAVPHHFINNLSIQDDYDAGKYESEAISALNLLFEKNKTLILCGGSGMYIDAVCKGFDPLPAIDEKHRTELNALFESQGIGALQALLLKLDPEHHANVDLNNPHRLIRALEITLATGTPYSAFRKGEGKKRNFKIIKIGLSTDRDLLYTRINERVDLMMEHGFLEEAERLYPFRQLNALRTVGYNELFDYIGGKTSLPAAVDLIKQNTRRFSKRQMTWFRKDEEITWLDPLRETDLVNTILSRIQSV